MSNQVKNVWLIFENICIRTRGNNWDILQTLTSSNNISESIIFIQGYLIIAFWIICNSSITPFNLYIHLSSDNIIL